MSTRSLLARLACGATLLVTAGSGLAAATGSADGLVTARAPLTDLLPAVPNPTDGAEARFWAYPDGQGTTAIFVVTGLSPLSVGTTFGAHVHNGPCIHGAGPAAGPHFNIGGPADTEHEVWLDFTVRPGGVAVTRTSVPFVIPHGAANSVVIHEQPTQVGGGAGPRMACLPVSF